MARNLVPQFCLPDPQPPPGLFYPDLSNFAQNEEDNNTEQQTTPHIKIFLRFRDSCGQTFLDDAKLYGWIFPKFHLHFNLLNLLQYNQALKDNSFILFYQKFLSKI